VRRPHCFGTSAVFTLQNLTEDWPLQRKFPDQFEPPAVFRRTVLWYGCKRDCFRLKLNKLLEIEQLPVPRAIWQANAHLSHPECNQVSRMSSHVSNRRSTALGVMTLMIGRLHFFVPPQLVQFPQSFTSREPFRRDLRFRSGTGMGSDPTSALESIIFV